MKNLIAITTFAFIALFSLSGSSWCAEPSVEDAVNKFIKVVASGNREALSNTVSYPLRREPPFNNINTPVQFLEAFDELFDEAILKAISSSTVSSDWSEVGWRGIMFQNGKLWIDEEGKITAVNHETEKGKRRKTELIEADRQRLHSSLKTFAEPVLEWETERFRIRIDRLADNKYRYAAWPLSKTTSEKPDLVLGNGTVDYEGTGGDHFYEFKSGPYRYRCMVNIMGAEAPPQDELEVTKDNEVVLRQPVINVIKGR